MSSRRNLKAKKRSQREANALQEIADTTQAVYTHGGKAEEVRDGDAIFRILPDGRREFVRIAA